MDNEWKFKDAKNTRAFTLFSILKGKQRISHVSHDEEGDWQFLGEGDPDPKDAAIICLEEAVKIDLTINELWNLPTGWHAYKESTDKEWVREPWDKDLKQI